MTAEEEAAAARALRASFRELTSESPRDDDGLLPGGGALAGELRAGRRGDALLAHLVGWLLVPAADGPKLRPDEAKALGLAGLLDPAAMGPAAEELEQIATTAALVRRTCARVGAACGEAAAALAAVELAECGLGSVFARIEALDPRWEYSRLTQAEVGRERRAIRAMLIGLLAASGGPLAAADVAGPPPPWAAVAGRAVQALASQLLRAARRHGVPRLFAAARADRRGVIQAALRRLAAGPGLSAGS